MKENGLPVEKIKIGIKTPPYTYLGQFQAVVGALAAAPDVIDFITACNTLGTTLSFLPTGGEYLLGGLSGPSLHPLALGNVCTLRKLLDEYGSGELSDVGVIGVGGVCDGKTFGAMRRAGANVVGVGVGVGVEVERWGIEKGVERAFGGIMVGTLESFDSRSPLSRI